MNPILVDSNVLLDVITQDPVWFAWSSSAIGEAGTRPGLAINAVIYAEVSVRYSRIEELEAVLPKNRFVRLDLPYGAAFLAGKAHASYRRRGGARHSPLPDFFIGAHAAYAGLSLLTRDVARYRTHFPALRLISPEDD